MTTPAPPSPDMSAIRRAAYQAAVFDQRRNCRWNDAHVNVPDLAPVFRAKDIAPFASLGDQCDGSIVELALLHTLRPCRSCGSEYLYFHNYGVSCCSCFGDPERCENHKEDAEALERGEEPSGCCCNYAENANLRDAITRWNLFYGDSGPRGRVQAIG